jgi:hypothetical protein
VQRLRWAACPSAVSARSVAARAGGLRRLIRSGALVTCLWWNCVVFVGWRKWVSRKCLVFGRPHRSSLRWPAKAAGANAQVGCLSFGSQRTVVGGSGTWLAKARLRWCLWCVASVKRFGSGCSGHGGGMREFCHALVVLLCEVWQGSGQARWACVWGRNDLPLAQPQRSSGRPYGGFFFLLIGLGQRHRVAA